MLSCPRLLGCLKFQSLAFANKTLEDSLERLVVQHPRRRTLVMSIFHTLKALFWALVLLILIVYVFATLLLDMMLVCFSCTHNGGRHQRSSRSSVGVAAFSSSRGSYAGKQLLEDMITISSRRAGDGGRCGGGAGRSMS